MAQVTRAAVDALTAQVNALSADAREKVSRVLDAIDWEGGDVAGCRQAIVDALAAALPAYADAAAQASADFYDAAREVSVGKPFGAVAESGLNLEATEGAVRAFVQDVVDGKPAEQLNRKVLDRVDCEMKRAAANSTAANARRDPAKPKWARVPSGRETCSFCLMLASRGAVYGSSRSAGAVDHYHANCDCRVVPDFGDGIEGYDPDTLYSDYLDGKFGTFRYKKKRRAGRKADSVGRGFESVGEMARYLEDAPDIDALHSRADEVQAVLGEWFEGKKEHGKYLAMLRRSASRRHVELTSGGKKGRVVYTKPRSELEDHEKAGIDRLTARGFDIETIPEIGDAPANLDIVMDGEEWEMKNVTNARGSVGNQLARARKKFYRLPSLPRRYVFTCEGASDSFDDAASSIEERMRDGETAIVIGMDGEMRRIKK